MPDLIGIDSDSDSDLIDERNCRKTLTIVVHSESFPPSKVVSVEHERVLTETGRSSCLGFGVTAWRRFACSRGSASLDLVAVLLRIFLPTPMFR